MEVWFESTAAKLRPSPEGFASALLLPSLRIRRPLILDMPVSPVWYDHVLELLPIFQEWWHLPLLSPRAPLAALSTAPSAPTTALYFSGGIDSFYSLLRSTTKIDYLIAVEGFDVPLSYRSGLSLLESSLREVAAECGMQPLIVRTNVRRHWSFWTMSWKWTHGGVLAGVGHLLSDHVGRVLISSSRSLTNLSPWGSHWRTDSLWSSEQLQVVNHAAQITRRDKVKELANEPLVRKHLRVCLENRNPAGNCSRCLKCLVTRLILCDLGVLEGFKTLEGEASLARDIDALAYIDNWLNHFRKLAEGGNFKPEVKQALHRLVTRSESPDGHYWRRGIRELRRMGPWPIRHR